LQDYEKLGAFYLGQAYDLEKGIMADALAENVAAGWKNGLADWGQDGERIRNAQGRLMPTWI